MKYILPIPQCAFLLSAVGPSAGPEAQSDVRRMGTPEPQGATAAAVGPGADCGAWGAWDWGGVIYIYTCIA